MVDGMQAEKQVTDKASFLRSYWSRKFKRHMDLKRSARMTGVPQLGVPDILVDDEDDRSPGGGRQRITPMLPQQQQKQSGGFLSAASSRPSHSTWSSGRFADLSLHDTSPYEQQPQQQQPAPPPQHPLSAPRSQQRQQEGALSPGGGGGMRHRNATSAFSFELLDGAHAGPGPEESGSSGDGRDRRSVVSPQVREMLDDRVWLESIKRSTTVRRYR